VNRHEQIRVLVLNEIADDYEEPTHIREMISREFQPGGCEVDGNEILDALLDLLRAGLAKAYKLSSVAPYVEVAASSDLPELGRCYFWITPEGVNVLRNWKKQRWPFDDEGEIVNG